MRYDSLRGARSVEPVRWCGAIAEVTFGLGVSWVFATSRGSREQQRRAGHGPKPGTRCEAGDSAGRRAGGSRPRRAAGSSDAARWQWVLFNFVLLHPGRARRCRVTWSARCSIPASATSAGWWSGARRSTSVYRGCKDRTVARDDADRRSALDALDARAAGLTSPPTIRAMLDAMVVVARCRAASACMQARAGCGDPFLGAGAGSRATSATTRRAGWSAPRTRPARGRALVMFPEGTRTVRAPRTRCRPGIAMIAEMRTGADPDRDHRDRIAVPGQGLADLARAAFPGGDRVRLGQRFAPDGRSPGAARALEALLGNAHCAGRAAPEPRETIMVAVSRSRLRGDTPGPMAGFEYATRSCRGACWPGRARNGRRCGW